jgi:hypothetical protein
MEEKPIFNVKQEIVDAIEKFRDDFKHRSFSQRHPELGKMLKCQICLRRHRSSQTCHQVFTTGTHDPAPEGEKKLLMAAETRKGVLGAARFAKQRIHPHHSHRLLELVQLTQTLFPKYFDVQIKDPKKAMQAARGEARHILVRKYRARRRILQHQRQLSRRINRGS